MFAPDRRAFFRLAAGAAALDAGRLLATSPPPPKPAAALKPLDGTGVVPLPTGVLRRLGTPAMRIPGNVNALQFSPKGTTLVSATSGELRGWDPRTGKVLFRLPFPDEASVDAGRLTSRDTFVLLVRPHQSGGSFEFRQYAFVTGKLLSRSPAVKIEHSQRSAFAVDGSLAAIVHNAALCVHDTATGAEKWRESLPAEAVADAVFFHDGATIALAGKGEVKLFATATGKPTGTLKAAAATGNAADGKRARDDVTDLAVSADSKWLAASVGEDEDTVLLWDVKGAKVRDPLKPARKPLGFNADGSELATVNRGVVTVWSTASGKAVRQFPVPTGEVHLSPDGTMLAADAGDAAILIDAATGKHLPHSADPPGNPSALEFISPTQLRGRLNQWGGWVEWNVRTGIRTLVQPPGVTGQTPVTLTADGRVGLFRYEGEYTAFAMATGKPLRSVKQDEERDADALPTLALGPDGQSFVHPAADGLVVVTDQGRRVIPRGGEAPGEPTAVITNGRTAVVGYRGGEGGSRIDLYDLTAIRHLRAIRLDGDPSQLALSTDGTRIVVAHDTGHDFRRGQQGITNIFDVRTGKSVFRVQANEDDYQTALALSLDGRMLARLGSGGRVRVWEVASAEVRMVLEVGKDAELNAVAFSPDGRTLAVSANGGPVFVWDLYAGPAGDLSADTCECVWHLLKYGDATDAFEAVRVLVRTGAEAVRFLAGKVTRLAAPDPRLVDRLITDLDHKEFRKREAAARALAELGERARADTTRALGAGPNAEVRDRLEKLLAADERPTAEQLRRLRAIEVVELVGSPDAVRLLNDWAGGAPGASFTSEASAAARRLSDRLK